MGNRFMTVITIAVVLGGSAACATKGFVRDQVYVTHQEIETLSETVEQTQERTRVNEVKIGEVDNKAAQAGLWAKGAEGAALSARGAADAASAKAEAVDRAAKRLLFEVILSEDEGNFRFGSAELPAMAMRRIDQLIDQLKADPRGAFVEIEGHTDSVGSKDVNDRVGLARAEAVKRYLHERHEVPLHKMNVITYGEERPIAPNKTGDGRARNRRVVIRVLA